MSRLISLAAAFAFALSSAAPAQDQDRLFAEDGLEMTVDVYEPEGGSDGSETWIVAAHQAGSSRGEYRDIAPRLAALGYGVIALDQRSGGTFAGVANETAARAAADGRATDFVAAIPDLAAGLTYARGRTGGRVVLWGSSYSAALALVLAGEAASAEGVDARLDAVVSMSPGEYLSGLSVRGAAAEISASVLIVSPPSEVAQWRAMFAAIPHERKVGFAAPSGGRHGSSALIPVRSPNPEPHWEVVDAFLAEHAPPR